MPKSKKPEWLKRKIAEGYARRAGKTARGLLVTEEQRQLLMPLNPDERDRMLGEAIKDADPTLTPEQTARIDNLFGSGRDRIVRMYHVPQWNQDGFLTWHAVSVTQHRRFSCEICGNSWQDNGQGIREGFNSRARGVAQVQSEACEHIAQVAIAGRLPFVEDAADQGGVKVFRPPALWVERTTTRINEGITRATQQRQAQQAAQIRAQAEQQRQREAEERDVAERTRLMHEVVNLVSELPTSDRPRIETAISGLVEALRRRPVAQHLPPIGTLLGILRGPLVVNSKRRAIESLTAEFVPPTQRYNEQLEEYRSALENAERAQADMQTPRIIRHPDGTIEPARRDVFYDVNAATREHLLNNFFADSPLQTRLSRNAHLSEIASYGDIAGTKQGRQQPKPPPKPTGNRFSSKRKFKLPEEK